MILNSLQLLICFLCGLDLLCPALASWLLLAMPSATQVLTDPPHVDYKRQCLQMHYLLPRQRELCTLSQNMLYVVSQGASLALEECQTQFAYRRWNCSTLPQTQRSLQDPYQNRHLRLPELARQKLNKTSFAGFEKMLADVPPEEDLPVDPSDVFGGALRFQSREKAYVHAIAAAGAAYSITKACRDGRLSSCKCDPNVYQRKSRYKAKKRKVDKQESWSWGGCSDHVSYGERISKDFVDSTEFVRWRQPAPQLMNLHNNEAGRRALRRNLKTLCKCHGISGSCTMKVCWRQMKSFHLIGAKLQRRFDGAIRVTLKEANHKLMPQISGHKRPRRRDLVYLEDSPNYCEPNAKYDIPGTLGRRCNKTSYGMDGCALMCCGRGYTSKVVDIVEDCNCKFVWCCRVMCAKCRKRVEQNYCK